MDNMDAGLPGADTGDGGTYFPFNDLARFSNHIYVNRTHVSTLLARNFGGVLLPSHADVLSSRGPSTCILFGQRRSN